jgi:hypothetical protein
MVMAGCGDSIVRQALDNVRSQCAPIEWSVLTPSQITKAIYREIRRLDLDKLHTQVEHNLRKDPKDARRVIVKTTPNGTTHLHTLRGYLNAA